MWCRLGHDYYVDLMKNFSLFALLKFNCTYEFIFVDQKMSQMSSN